MGDGLDRKEHDHRQLHRITVPITFDYKELITGVNCLKRLKVEREVVILVVKD